MTHIKNAITFLKSGKFKEPEDAYKYFNQTEFVLEDRGNEQQKWSYLDKSEITDKDLNKIVAQAKKNMTAGNVSLKKTVAKWQENAPRAAEMALELSIKDLDNGRYDSKINHSQFMSMLDKVSTKTKQVEGSKMEKLKKIAGKFDELANEIRANVVAGSIHPKIGYKIEMGLDKLADVVENHNKIVTANLRRKKAGPADAKALTFGKNQPQRESDEPYMADFGDGQVHQQDADEWYMNYYKDGENNEVKQSNDPAINESATTKKTYGPSS